MPAARGAHRFAVVAAIALLVLGVLWWDVPGVLRAVGTGSITGQAYVDANDDGVRQGGEAALPDLPVRLTGTRDSCPVGEQPACAASATTTTSATGEFTFTGLEAGLYSVTAARPAGYADGKSTAGAAGGSVSAPNQISGIRVDSGASATGYSFGMRVGAVTGTAWVDNNANGTIEDDEHEWLEDVTVTLVKSDETPVATTTTSTTGNYSFDAVLPGDYVVRATLPAGYGAASPTSVPFTLASGQGRHVDFSMVKGALGNFVWLDADRDGLQGIGEDGVPGIAVELHRTPGGVVDSQLTDANGEYYFVGLDVGTYFIRVIKPSGTVFTERDKSATVGSHVDADGYSSPVEIKVENSGITQDMTLDAGFYELAQGETPPTTTTTTTTAPTTTTTTTPTTTTTSPTTTTPTTTTTGPTTTTTGSTTTTGPTTTTGATTSTTPPTTTAPGTTTTTTTTPPRTDLGVQFAVDNPKPAVGDKVTFTTVVVNRGTAPVEGSRVTITLPDGLRPETGTGQNLRRALLAQSGWTCQATGRQLVCANPATVQPGASFEPLTVVTTATAPVLPQATTVAVALYDGTPDDNPDNDGTTPALAIPSTTTPTPGVVTELLLPTQQPTTTPLATTGRPAHALLLTALVLMVLGAGLLVTTRKPATGGRHRAARRSD